jgi:hypothetical protein
MRCSKSAQQEANTDWLALQAQVGCRGRHAECQAKDIETQYQSYDSGIRKLFVPV